MKKLPTIYLILSVVSTLFVPAHAKPRPLPYQTSQPSKQDSSIYRVGGDVRAPRPVSAPLPMPPTKIDKPHTVVLSFIVTAEGTVRDVTVVKHFRPEFDKAAVDAAATWKFEPATKAGMPVSVRLEAKIDFKPL